MGHMDAEYAWERTNARSRGTYCSLCRGFSFWDSEKFMYEVGSSLQLSHPVRSMGCIGYPPPPPSESDTLCTSSYCLEGRRTRGL